MGELEIVPRQKSAWGSSPLPTMGADDGQLRNNPPDGNLLFPNQVAEVAAQSMGKNLLESPSIRLLTSRSCGDIFLLLDCAVGAQSRANQFGRKRGLKT
jgi:hypothetical protein